MTGSCGACGGQGYVNDAACPACRGRRAIGLTACPVHEHGVGVDRRGRIVGKCPGCAGEAADGLIWLRRNPRVAA